LFQIILKYILAWSPYVKNEHLFSGTTGKKYVELVIVVIKIEGGSVSLPETVTVTYTL